MAICTAALHSTGTILHYLALLRAIAPFVIGVLKVVPEVEIGLHRSVVFRYILIDLHCSPIIVLRL
jgi:hypothetical protein